MEQTPGQFGDQEKRSHELEFYRLVVDSLPTAVLTVDGEYRITGFNPWAEKITGYSREEAMGRSCSEILQGALCGDDCPLRAAIDRNESVSLVETTIRNRWGEFIPVRMSTAALFDKEGKLLGGIESFHDISRLKTLERERNNLISMFAHDMKSSLSIIGGFVLRLLKPGNRIQKSKRQKYLEIVEGELSKLETLINSFLDFSRLFAGKMKMNFTATELDRELLEIAEAFQMQAAKKGIELEYRRREEAVSPIKVDCNHLRRVFKNLLDNAIKFSGESGKVTLLIEETADEVIVRVEDQGIGIAPEELPYIFDAFTRGRDTESGTGFGLGLAGAKRIIEGHGGRIRVESMPGKGSKFSVILPKNRPDERGITPDARSQK
jgi:PAS domain S-box-containing protein